MKHKPSSFDGIHREESLRRLRSMLADPTLQYRTIAQRFGITRQRVAQIAAEMGVDGRERQRQRTLRTPAVQPAPDYPANVLVVSKRPRRNQEAQASGFGSSAVSAASSKHPRYVPAAQRILLVNGLLCRIYCRRAAIQTGRSGREYVLFTVGKRTKEVKAALFGFWRGRRLKLYVFPVRDLKKVSSVWLPYGGRYAVDHNIKPKRDWTAYEEAWGKLNNLSQSRS